MGEFAMLKSQQLVDRLIEVQQELAVIDGQMITVELTLDILRERRAKVLAEMAQIKSQYQWQERSVVEA